MKDVIAGSIDGYTQLIVDLIAVWLPRLCITIVVLLIGLWIINRLVDGFSRTLERRDADPTLTRFVCSLSNITLKVMLLISVAGMVGIETTSFVAVLGASGLAIGLALQGSLANFAGGVLILLFKPYRVGDFIEAQGVLGTVKAIEIFNTVLNTSDNKRIVVPNGLLSNGIITNFSAETTRRIDFEFGIGYGDDIKQAREVIKGLITADDRILKEPEPMIVVGSLGDNAVNLVVRVWAHASDYWGVHFDLIENTKIAFDENGISIPFPQRDVHIFNPQ